MAFANLLSLSVPVSTSIHWEFYLQYCGGHARRYTWRALGNPQHQFMHGSPSPLDTVASTSQAGALRRAPTAPAGCRTGLPMWSVAMHEPKPSDPWRVQSHDPDLNSQAPTNWANYDGISFSVAGRETLLAIQTTLLTTAVLRYSNTTHLSSWSMMSPWKNLNVMSQTDVSFERIKVEIH